MQLPSELCILLQGQGSYRGSSVVDIFRTNFKVCSCIFRICRNRKWEKYEYWTILQL